MKVIVPGHSYELSNFEPTPEYRNQALSFIEKSLDERGQFVTVVNGTTNEEVLKVLIDRIRFLNAKGPCRQNSIVLTKLEEALMWLNNRTEERVARGVENTPNP